MDSDSTGDKRNLDDMCQSGPSTPFIRAHPRKVVKQNEGEVSNLTILQAINTIVARFETQEKKLEDLSLQLKQNCVITSLTKASEFNATEMNYCKARLTEMEKDVGHLRAENVELQERSREQDRYI